VSISSNVTAVVTEDTSTVWWPWVLLLLIVAGLGIWLVMLTRRRREWDADFTRDLGEARWVADSLLPSVTSRDLPPAQLNQTWLDGKRRVDDLNSDLYRLGSAAPSSGRATRVREVSGALGSLQQSLEHDVALRSGGLPSDPIAVIALETSRQEVTRQRDALVAAIDNQPPATHHSAT
jgi:hypothetical protein